MSDLNQNLQRSPWMRILKIIILVTLILQTSFLFSQSIFQRPPERVSASVFYDHFASVKEDGLNIGIRAGYEGVIYALLQYENFAALEGGFDSFGAVIGVNFEQQTRGAGTFYQTAGIRLIPLVWRAGGHNPNFGIEAGLDWSPGISGIPGISIGARLTHDWREDKNIFDSNTADWETSGYFYIRFELSKLSGKSPGVAITNDYKLKIQTDEKRN